MSTAPLLQGSDLEGRHPWGAATLRLPTLLAGTLVWPPRRQVVRGRRAWALLPCPICEVGGCRRSGHSTQMRGAITGTRGLQAATAAQITREHPRFLVATDAAPLRDRPGRGSGDRECQAGRGLL